MKLKLQRLLLPLMTFLLVACGGDVGNESTADFAEQETANEELITVVEGDPYQTAQEVVDYLYHFAELPPNYLTKEEARDLGWIASEGNLWDVAPEASIGGDYFGNFEGFLPEQEGRDYYEADIEYEGGRRNAKRLIYSNDDLYFYTEDHYETFVEMTPGGENR